MFVWTEWQNCKFISLDEAAQMVKCETLDGDADYEFRHVAPYLSQTISKPPVLVEVVHRKFNAARDKP